ncbi:MAG: TSUP family transporter [Solirubrobacteraceae bacterium]
MIAALAIGVAGGVLAGMLGVGGGILFVPALVVLLGFHQVNAEATSLLAILPVAVVGTWRQYGYGNVRLRDGMLVGLLAAGGAVGGVAVANAVPQRILEVGFGLLALGIAGQLLRRGLGSEAERPD